MSLRQRGYLNEEIIGIPISKFKVGKKVRLERRQIYANPGHVPAARETTRTISWVEKHKDQYGDKLPFLLIRFKEMKRRVFRTSGRKGVLSIYSHDPKPLKYDVIEVL